MAQDLKRCVSQIRDATSFVHGTGFIIDPYTAVTCAHVVEAAGAAPGDSVTIAFALTGHTCPIACGSTTAGAGICSGSPLMPRPTRDNKLIGPMPNPKSAAPAGLISRARSNSVRMNSSRSTLWPGLPGWINNLPFGLSRFIMWLA